ncbi:universal stress protein [Saccharopolyspora phatthalungensis]|uniref:Nucleotide-binding universal stress UspA family protein n=1 Tax=Saccharopolyspora phatthalungensis TaxID=664693 RepID=A0A840Q6E2_9PSEU|nr:universal stress protein [Saccharopolyspora phatthalungensis]MBB5156036.1 nucleotide-binding universal stress UspA family protein [Saccharopolyspora phatthalungensis]
MAAAKQPVVAGVDGSDQSLRAALWAADEAVHRQAALDLVIVVDEPARTPEAGKMVQKAAERCSNTSPALAITEEVVVGHPVEELVRRSRQARMIVVGSRGRGGFSTALLGSVSTAVAMHAECPVIVVRGEDATTGPVVVGVDDSPASQAALQFAFAAAAQRKTELVAMQVWHEKGLLAAAVPAADRDQIQSRIERSLSKQVARLTKAHTDVRIHTLAQRGHPVAALADASRDAQLLVVGHRGGGGFSGLFLGSVAAGILHYAPCPVAVVRPSQPDQQ